MSVLHPTWLCTYTDSYARGQGPAMDRETVYFHIWILQAAIGFRPNIYALHVEILYANIHQTSDTQDSLFHSFLHVDSISMLTNRPCHGP